jgi:catalase-peroxidase
MAMKMDPVYRKICRAFHKDPDYFSETFARAWFKLTHRDMGPKARYIGPDVPEEDLIWQDPVPAGPPTTTSTRSRRRSRPAAWHREMVAPPGTAPAPSAARTCAAAPTARASASRRRRTGRATSPSAWPRCWACSRHRGRDRRQRRRRHRAGRQCRYRAGGQGGRRRRQVPFAPGRGDATDEMTDAESFAPLEPMHDGYRNWLKKDYAVSAEE